MAPQHAFKVRRVSEGNEKGRECGDACEVYRRKHEPTLAERMTIKSKKREIGETHRVAKRVHESDGDVVTRSKKNKHLKSSKQRRVRALKDGSEHGHMGRRAAPHPADGVVEVRKSKQEGRCPAYHPRTHSREHERTCKAGAKHELFHKRSYPYIAPKFETSKASRIGKQRPKRKWPPR